MKTQIDYNVDYFIGKFSAIPEDKWCVNTLAAPNGRFCAYGHCGVQDGIYENLSEKTDWTEEGEALKKILSRVGGVAEINDGDNPRYFDPTPKQRILAALYDIKKSQQPEVKTITKYVAVDAEIKQEAKETILQDINS